MNTCSNEGVIFPTRIQKIHGSYRQMECVMCQACYEAKRYCPRTRVQAGDVVQHKDYISWRERQKELEKMQKTLEIQQHHDDLKAGKVG